MLSDCLDVNLILVLTKLEFYMTSYIVYLLATQLAKYPRKIKKGSLRELNAWSYIVYP